MIKILALICMLSNIVSLVLHILVILGAPVGEYTYGGLYMEEKILPKKQRISSIFSAFISLLISILYGYIGGINIPLLDYIDVKYFALIFLMFMCLNIMSSIVSKSKKEKLTVLPVQLIGILSGLIVCLNI